MKLKLIKLMRPIFFNGHQDDKYPNDHVPQCSIEVKDSIIEIVDKRYDKKVITTLANLLFAEEDNYINTLATIQAQSMMVQAQLGTLNSQAQIQAQLGDIQAQAESQFNQLDPKVKRGYHKKKTI